jgi:hypothetical protein
VKETYTQREMLKVMTHRSQETGWLQVTFIELGGKGFGTETEMKRPILNMLKILEWT